MINAETQGEDGESDAVAEELAASLRWLHVEGIGQARLRQLVQRLGGAERALHAATESIGEALGATPEVAARLSAVYRDVLDDLARRLSPPGAVPDAETADAVHALFSLGLGALVLRRFGLGPADPARLVALAARMAPTADTRTPPQSPTPKDLP